MAPRPAFLSGRPALAGGGRPRLGLCCLLGRRYRANHIVKVKHLASLGHSTAFDSGRLSIPLSCFTDTVRAKRHKSGGRKPKSDIGSSDSIMFGDMRPRSMSLVRPGGRWGPSHPVSYGSHAWALGVHGSQGQLCSLWRGAPSAQGVCYPPELKTISPDNPPPLSWVDILFKAKSRHRPSTPTGWSSVPGLTVSTEGALLVPSPTDISSCSRSQPPRATPLAAAVRSLWP